MSLAYVALIWVVSNRPGDELSVPGGWDKAAHLLEYAILGFLLGRGLGRERWWAALLAAAAYGALDEIHQSFVPGRFASVFDGIADFAGAAAGVFLAALTDGRFRREEPLRK